MHSIPISQRSLLYLLVFAAAGALIYVLVQLVNGFSMEYYDRRTQAPNISGHRNDIGYFIAPGMLMQIQLSLAGLLLEDLDDGHSGVKQFSWRNGESDGLMMLSMMAQMGYSLTERSRVKKALENVRKAAYPDGVPGYEEVGNTAYLTFDHFTLPNTDLDDYYVENLEDLPIDGSDTVALVIRAHERITREGSPIQNVVIDLSCNTGGAVDAGAYLTAWCLGKSSVSIKDTFTGAMANTDYWADVNLDRQFDETDTITDKNIYCLISPVSFSCGNLVPNVFKQSGKVTLLGRTSGGGSCIVQMVSTAWGTSFNISAPRRMSFLKNGSLYDIDRGADPDYSISTPAKYYNRQALTNYINTLY